jgi:hypothetical protein
MSPSGRPSGEGLARVLFVALACAGLAFWFAIGLPWGPHNESFDWVVRLEQRTLWQALFEKFPSVLSLRPIGTGAAWLLYRLGGHDPGFAEVVNACIALLAWGWVARSARESRLFALVALVTGGVFFAGYIWVFHLHGLFYGPLLVYLAMLVRGARGRLDLRALLAAFVAALVTALVHPYALPLALVFAVGARARDAAPAFAGGRGGPRARRHRRRRRVPAARAVVQPRRRRGSDRRTHHLAPYHRGQRDRLRGRRHPRRVDRVARFPGAAGAAAAAFTLLLAAVGVWLDMPVLPLWFAWAATKSLRQGHVTLAALIAGTALLPLANPTGSPTYAVFVLFVTACATVQGESATEARLERVRPWLVAVVLVLMAVLAGAVRSGVPVPVVSSLARPLLAEGERTRQLTGLGATLMRSAYRDHAARFLHPAVNPTEGDAVDRRFRPPTEDAHLATWLDWQRGDRPRWPTHWCSPSGARPCPAWTPCSSRVADMPETR